MRSSRLLVASLLLPAALAVQGRGTAPQRPAAPPPPALLFEEGSLAWDRGEYPAALRQFRLLLTGPGAAAWLDRVAEITGEVYQTTELTPDGTRPFFSGNSQVAAYESRLAPKTTTVVRVADGGRVAEVPGSGGILSPSGTLLTYFASDAGRAASLRVRDLARGIDLPVHGLGEWAPTSVVFGDSDMEFYLVAARPSDGSRNDILRVQRDGDGFVVRAPAPSGEGYKGIVVPVPGGRYLVHTVVQGNPVRLQAGATGLGGANAFGVIDLAAGTSRRVAGSGAALSADGSTLAYLVRNGNETALMVEPVAGRTPVVAKRAAVPLAAPALSPDGSQVAFQMTPVHDAELYLVHRDGREERRLTREIQHDLMPVWLDGGRILAVMGEARHRRSYLYDAAALTRTRLFHNNTVRTVAPEYQWVPSPDGSKVLTVAERDGDTVSPEQGVYLTDLSRKVSVGEVLARIDAQLAVEERLRSRGAAAFRPIAAQVKGVTDQVDVARIYRYQKALFDFDSKHISRPGNALAIDYLLAQYRAFGYAAEPQWFSPNGALGGRTANVLAVLRGTEHPELVYVVSSHFDSRAEGPGADDNTSGTAALLEAARVLAHHPMPATIVFASFTGEESGLLGSREWVRRAVADSLRVVGALNNDMIGWSNDHRLDNTIRYSNPGIRDIQHAAAIQFSRLITYDALYYKSTDAHAYYDAWGDIVGGIGSYPILGNPHYHQPHDVLEVENHQWIAEVSRTTVATLMHLASSPSRLGGLRIAARRGTQVELHWTPSPEKGVARYQVAALDREGNARILATVAGPRATLPNVAPGTLLGVRGVNARGLEGWDWARVAVE